MEIQMAIDQGRIELEGVNKNKSTKIDGHPFPQGNMVVADIGKGIKDNKSASSSDAKKSRFDNEPSPSKQPRRVTSQMLLEKYKRRREQRRRQEEEYRRERRYQEERDRRSRSRGQSQDDHWKCPFFIYCWNEGLRLPSVDSYPRCNGRWLEYRPESDRRCFNDEHRPIKNCVSAHDRLGKRVFDRQDEADEEEFDELMTEAEQKPPKGPITQRELEHQENCRYDPDLYPQWCPGGLTRS